MYPFVVVMQSHLFTSHLTVVAPLVRQDNRSGFSQISTAVTMSGEDYLVMLGELASVETRLLLKPIADLRVYEDDLRRAIDRLFTGF